ncbi:myeloid leukemia factor isoform X1 [Musca autumnalis]|uniref:myeloid leukemia factor isoform X1 n=1 Tax=Musca autumnalis TaxID=221902 RepID=UPI003CEDF0DB
MSLFGSLMGDFDDDIFGSHMNAMNMQMRSMNRLMNSLMPDPFNMLTPFDPGFQQNSLMERQNGPAMGGLFGFPAMGPMMMPNMNRLLSADIGNNGASFCSSSVITMSSGPDGRPQIYQATSSTKTGPGGIRETRRTVQDSVNGVKKMAIGHHIGERAHIIEKEQDVRSGQLEERQEFINLDEDEAEDFDREFTTKASGGRMGPRAIGGIPQQTLTIEPLDDDDDDEVIETTGAAAAVPHISHPQQHRPSSSSSSSSGSHNRRYLPALPAPPPQQQQSSHQNSSSSSYSTTNETRKSADNTSPSSSSAKSRIEPSSGRTAATSTNNNSNTSNTSSSSYVSTTPRRLSAYRSGSSHIGGVSPRRSLRTPPSSPLATTPTMHNHSTTSSPSVHPHPYNSSAARRSHHHHNHHHHHHHHRSKHGKHTSHSPAPANSNKSSSSSEHKEESNNQN